MPVRTCARLAHVEKKPGTNLYLSQVSSVLYSYRLMSPVNNFTVLWIASVSNSE